MYLYIYIMLYIIYIKIFTMLIFRVIECSDLKSFEVHLLNKFQLHHYSD